MPFCGHEAFVTHPLSKVADTRDFTLTPTLSLKGEGELKDPDEIRQDVAP